MAHKEFILQGFTTRTHKDAIRELFDVANVEKIYISVAFISENGVHQIEDVLTKHGPSLTAFAGIRNDITSHQGLLRIQNIPGSTLYVVDTGSRNVLFHPKLYLVRGVKESRLMVGSANLTLGGLNNNIEAGILITLDMSDPADKELVDQIEAQLISLPEEYKEHVIHMDAATKIDALLAAGRVTDETIRIPTSSFSSGGSSASDPLSRIKLKSTPLRPSLRPARPARTAASATGATTTATPTPVLAPATTGSALDLVWQSKPLTERDLNIPTGTTTNKTGSVNLDKGLLPEAEDHRPYFRNKVFDALNWTYRAPTVDEAYAQFGFILKGISYGVYDLAIRHTNSTTSKSYLQNNAMTRLSWGPLKDYVSDASLIDRTLSLYRDKVDPTRFVLEID